MHGVCSVPTARFIDGESFYQYLTPNAGSSFVSLLSIVVLSKKRISTPNDPPDGAVGAKRL